MENYLVKTTTKIQEVLKLLESLEQKIVYVVDDDNKVLGSITDGDIRRYFMKNGNTASNAIECMHSPCFVCHSLKEGLKMIEKHKIVNIPLVDNKDVIIDLISESSHNAVKKISHEFDSVKVVMMAGGKGERLYPYTSVLPKPLIPIAGIPIAERILMRYKEAGLMSYILSLNYKKNLIKTYFDDAMEDCKFEYVEENEPLGTGGSLRLMKHLLTDTFIVINCDMLIDIDINELLNYHKNQKADLTMIVANKKIEIPYGVINLDGNEIISLEEKPTIEKFINTGMYVVNPSVFDFFPDANRFHMTDLCDVLLKEKRKVCAYVIDNDDFMDMGVFSELKNMNEKVG